MEQTEREKTTKDAIKGIDSLLKSKNYTSALLLSSIYVHIRLSSLLTDEVCPPRNEWKRVHGILRGGDLTSFNALVNLCDSLGLLRNHRADKLKKKLKDIWNKRGNIAHETGSWQEITQNEAQEITDLCVAAKEFLQKTTEPKVNTHNHDPKVNTNKIQPEDPTT